MHDSCKHKTDYRIVSMHQPRVRPIVRGKATAEVEFGAKVSLSMMDGHAICHRFIDEHHETAEGYFYSSRMVQNNWTPLEWLAENRGLFSNRQLNFYAIVYVQSLRNKRLGGNRQHEF
jgi:hypothetical protein